MAGELTQAQWQALIDAARECKRKGTQLRDHKIPVYDDTNYPEGNSATAGHKEYDLVTLLIKAVVDATTQIAAGSNVNTITAITANTFTDS